MKHSPPNTRSLPCCYGEYCTYIPRSLSQVNVCMYSTFQTTSKIVSIHTYVHAQPNHRQTNKQETETVACVWCGAYKAYNTQWGFINGNLLRSINHDYCKGKNVHIYNCRYHALDQRPTTLPVPLPKTYPYRIALFQIHAACISYSVPVIQHLNTSEKRARLSSQPTTRMCTH